MLKFIHAADFHLDSAFAALTPQQAAARRRAGAAEFFPCMYKPCRPVGKS